MIQNKLIIGAVLLALPWCASASGADYDYVHLAYADSATFEVNGADSKYDGYRLELSHAIGPTGFVVGEWQSADVEDLESGGMSIADTAFDMDRYSIGLGGRMGDGKSVDMYGIVSYERLDIDSNTDDGFGIEGGLRLTYGSVDSSGSNRVEFNPRVKYLDYGSFGSVQSGGGSVDIDDVNGFEVGIGALLYLTEGFAVSVDYSATSLNMDIEGASDEPDVKFDDVLAFGLRLHY